MWARLTYTYLYTDIQVCRLDPTFEEKWVRPRIIVLVGTRFNVGSIPGLDIGSIPHFSMGIRPKIRMQKRVIPRLKFDFVDVEFSSSKTIFSCLLRWVTLDNF